MSKNQRSIRFVIPFVVLVILSLAAVAIPQDVAERLDLKDDGQSDSGKGRKGAPEVVVPSNDLITAATYAFSTAGAVALEDMSSGTTQLIGPSIDDGNSALVNIGFEFWFDGVRFTQFGANGNGFIRLGLAPTGSSFTNALNNTTNAPKIAPYWDDLCTGTNGNVRFKTIGAAPNRKLIVEWNNMQITRGAGCAGVGTGTFQLWLFESGGAANQGLVQFVYGALAAGAAADGGHSVGMQSGAATNFASITTSTNTVSYVTSSNTDLTAIAAGTSYLFTPNVPAAPTGLNFTAVTATSQTLNWTDNASNEFGYVVYKSTDGINFTFLTQAAAGATSFNDTGLFPSTTYFYQVYAVSEGALSTVLAGSNATAAAGNITSAASGLWSNPATWTGGVVPTASDNVTIQNTHTVTIDSSNAFSVTVALGGVLEFENTTARTLTVGDDVVIMSGGTFQTAATGTQTGHVLSVGGDLTNNGTLDFSTNGNTAGAGITFSAGASNVTFGGTGATTDIRTITVAKGAQAVVVDLAVFVFTVQGVNTDVAGFLTLTSGTFKISGIFTMTNRTFPGPTYTIPLLGGIWLNNPNYTVARTASGTTTNNNGLFRMTQGVYGIGLTGADGMGGGAGSTFIVEGGTINAIRIDPQSATTFTMTGGTINLSDLAANTRSNFGSFELFSSTSVSTFDGGTINLINATVAATPVDFRVNGTVSTGAAPTVVNVGTAATATNFNFRLSGQTPSVVIDNTTNNKTATFIAQTLLRGNITVNPGTTFAINGFLVAPTAQGGFTRTMTNNGTITGNIANSRLYFLGQGAGSNMIYTGTGIAGTVGAPLISVDFDSVGGTALGGAANNLITARVILFTGNVSGSGKLECGVGGASTCTTQIGNTTTATAAGTFDAPFTFNLGTGGQVASYLRTTTPYSTGGEVNPARTLTTMNVDPNVLNNIVVAGGGITVTGTLTLTTGSLLTSSGNVLTHNGATATRGGTCTVANCYVDGPLARNVAVAAYTFHVGENGYSPVLVNTTILGTATTLTVEAFDATLQGFSPATSISRNWSLEESGDITADLSFTYNTDANDVNGTEANYRVFRREAGGVNTDMCGAPCVNTATNTLGPVIGVTTFSRWTGAENVGPTAAAVSLAGRVTTADGRGIVNAIMTIEGGGLPQPRLARTGPFGYYEFTELQAGQTYIVTISSKRFTFTVPSRPIQLLDSIGDFDFVAEP